MTEANTGGDLKGDKDFKIISSKPNQADTPLLETLHLTDAEKIQLLEQRHIEDEKIIEDLRQKLEQSEKDRMTDSLTGCYSCHAWMDLQLHYDQKRGDRVTLIMIDLNNLKKVNDQYGHDAGDEYLKNTASHLKTIFSRKGDKIYRVGGDEFVVACKFVAEEDREDFNSFISSSLGHNVIELLGLDFAYGVAHTDLQQDEALSDTYKRADVAMYKNKKTIKDANPLKYTR